MWFKKKKKKQTELANFDNELFKEMEEFNDKMVRKMHKMAMDDDFFDETSDFFDDIPQGKHKKVEHLPDGSKRTIITNSSRKVHKKAKYTNSNGDFKEYEEIIEPDYEQISDKSNSEKWWK